MPRIRTIKPELPRDKRLAGLSRDARYTFVLLITQADDDGCFTAEPRETLASLYPHDRDVTEELLGRWLHEELGASGLVEYFQTADGMVGRIANWKKHQRIDHPAKHTLNASLATSSRVKYDGLATRPRTLDLGPRTSVEPKVSTVSKKPVRQDGWSARAIGVWRQYQGEPVAGKLGAALKPLIIPHGVEEVLRRFAVFAQSADARFGFHHFREHFNTYGSDPLAGPAFPSHPPLEWVRQ